MWSIAASAIITCQALYKVGLGNYSMARTKKSGRAKNHRSLPSPPDSPPPPQSSAGATDEADTVVECFFSLLDASAHSPSAFTEDLIHLFESPARREPLLRSWKAWRTKNSSIPQKSLPTVRITNIPKSGAPAKKLQFRRALTPAPAPAPAVGAWCQRPPVARLEQEEVAEVEGVFEPVRGRKKKKVVVAWG
ncbi:hypothetical protein BJY01DRAFT_261220 [Aspergillus pseudoustus]|uniref:Uncharacterized protein n=1 Tax=Aspergillus pseudoustus TaxID=1810923 RepID=A0ABR4KFF0_9EURO